MSDNVKKIKFLILPKFETGEMTGDAPGEAQFIYEKYFTQAEKYEIKGNCLYVAVDIALCVTGMGKVNAALSTATVLADSRFDFSDAVIITTGCCGGSFENTVMGDVVIGTACSDFDLGHHADIRDLVSCGVHPDSTWYHDAIYDSSAVFYFDEELVGKVYSLTKDIQLETTPCTVRFMQSDSRFLRRAPRVIKGGIISGDNYWKGEFSHASAKKQADVYVLPGGYAATEMEDIAVCNAAARFGLSRRVIGIRGVVDMDVFMDGASAHEVFTAGAGGISQEDSLESADIFPTAMKNVAAVITAVIEGLR